MTATRRITVVWAALMALTFASFLVGIEQSAGAASAAAAIIVGIALFKVRLIGIHFMDLRVAPMPLRLIFEGYVLVVFVALTAIDLFVH
ncbi:cytochrome C oxidase subunit IV family protein [Mycobacterium sp. SMC-8]|uniref:cytochrome C oxidase subunit IV family protein n=1 Tax=Mycobacterium sp. SMC-8 TaxID=2857060 RepID=UPI0021B31E4E|nr:cytochrome C oxidase subunit IV family protein [Mycobacterium sp. SMC-8]UXA11508.1 cytochrome C oxidase subunit IV family protein [Mycobacterium sp. SMC-8]